MRGLPKGGSKRHCALIERAVALEPDYPLALAALTEVQAFRADIADDPCLFETAIATAKRAIAADPNLAESHIWLGYCMLLLDRPLESSRSLRRARELDPANSLAHYFSGAALRGSFRRDEARRLHDELTGQPCAQDPHCWRHGEALACFQRSIELWSQFAWAWSGAGLEHMDLGHLLEARRCFEESTRLEVSCVPPLSGTAVLLGECLRRLGDLGEARAHCLAGLDAAERNDHLFRDTFRGNGLCTLGRTALEQGDRDAARAAYRQAALLIRGRPRTRGGGPILVQALAGAARVGAGPEAFEEALGLFERREGWNFQWMILGSDDITLLDLARAARDLGRADQARDLLERAIDCGSIEATREAMP